MITTGHGGVWQVRGLAGSAAALRGVQVAAVLAGAFEGVTVQDRPVRMLAPGLLDVVVVG